MICQICREYNYSAIVCQRCYDYFNDEGPQALAAVNLEDNSDQQFYTDSGATSHMTKNPSNLERIKTYKGYDKILVGNGQGLQISHIGDTSLKTNHGNFNLKNVLVVPKLKKNLLSIS